MASALPQDPEFLARLKARDQAAFTVLVRRYHVRLQGFAGSIAGHGLAEDIMQDAWVSIWRGLPGFEGRASLNTWLYTIVRNECSARLRREGRAVTTQTPDPGDREFDDWLQSRFARDGHWAAAPGHWPLDSPDAMIEEAQLRDCLDHHIDRLQDTQQSVFRLRDLEQLSLDEICNILDLSHSNVRVLLHRARQKLLRVIDHYQETGEC